MSEVENGHESDDRPVPRDSNPRDCFAEMRVHFDKALRLLTDEEELPRAGTSQPSTAGYPSKDAADANSRQHSDSQRLRGIVARESALKELRASSALMDTLEKLVAGKKAPDSPEVAFENRIESAPEYTRAWLRASFTGDQDEISKRRFRESDASAATASDDGSPRMSPMMSGIAIPDELARQGLESPQVISSLGTAALLEFDALSFSALDRVTRRGITILGAYLEEKRGDIKQMETDGNITDSKAFSKAYMNFLTMVDQLYKPDALYHGAAHAMDVMSTSAWFLKSEGMKHFRALDQFMVVVAAAVHDVGHPGVNNLFLTKTMDPIAIRYNDKSCLENMHLAIVFELMQKDTKSDWFGLLDKSGSSSPKKCVREGLISMVLATDMATHARYVSQLATVIKERTARLAEGEPDQKKEQEENMVLLDIIVHSSDIANPAKPRDGMLAWTKRVNAEFWAQGDQELQLGIDVSPLCDRKTGRPSVPKGQMGFISFVVMPFYTKIAQLIPEANAGVDALTETLKFWKDAEDKGLSFDDIFEGVEPAIEC